MIAKIIEEAAAAVGESHEIVQRRGGRVAIGIAVFVRWFGAISWAGKCVCACVCVWVCEDACMCSYACVISRGLFLGPHTGHCNVIFRRSGDIGFTLTQLKYLFRDVGSFCLFKAHTCTRGRLTLY